MFAHRRLLDVRASFIDGVSEPVLKSLLDHLLEKKVIAECEIDDIKGIWSKSDKARSVIDLVRNKGEAASSIMIEFLCEKDPFFSEHLGLNI
uniref:CARD domain-containing protein n=1 Tax=Echeneis naucrates TaxID=173247 RepID=A0A665VL80_ECHNA